MSTKIEIPLSKTKAAIPIILLLLIGVSGFYGFLSPETFVSGKHKNPDTIQALGIAAAGISLGLIIPFALKWFRNKPGLIIDEEGITDISNVSYMGLIEWNDITGIKKVKNGPLKSIILMTDKPEKYINKAKKVNRRQMQKVHGFHGSPLMLVSSRLKIKHDDMVDLITKEFEKAKQTTT